MNSSDKQLLLTFFLPNWSIKSSSRDFIKQQLLSHPSGRKFSHSHTVEGCSLYSSSHQNTHKFYIPLPIPLATHRSSIMSPTCANDTFPFRLHSMLNSIDDFFPSAGSSSDTSPVTWLPHGRAFIVLDKDKFLTDIIPVYFSQTKMRSFTRQLNLWGFKR